MRGFERSDCSLMETDEAAFLRESRGGFGLGPEKMDWLRELYKKKALRLGMYYDDEAIAAIYKEGLRDGGGSTHV